MLFMREQRAQVVQECTLRESAAINQILGRKWHELDRNVQQKYYDMARDERMKHMQLYPGWSARDNYGAKKKNEEVKEKREKKVKNVLIRKNVVQDLVLINNRIGVNIANERKNVFVIQKMKQLVQDPIQLVVVHGVKKMILTILMIQKMVLIIVIYQ